MYSILHSTREAYTAAVGQAGILIFVPGKGSLSPLVVPTGTEACLFDASSSKALSVLQHDILQGRLALILHLSMLQVLQRMAGKELEEPLIIQLSMLEEMCIGAELTKKRALPVSIGRQTFEYGIPPCCVVTSSRSWQGVKH